MAGSSPTVVKNLLSCIGMFLDKLVTVRNATLKNNLGLLINLTMNHLQKDKTGINVSEEISSSVELSQPVRERA